FDLREEPVGEVIVVAETDDGDAVFERVARDVVDAGAIAAGDRVWAETTLNLGRVVGFDRLRTGSRLVNALRRIKTGEELATQGTASTSATAWDTGSAWTCTSGRSSRQKTRRPSRPG